MAEKQVKLKGAEAEAAIKRHVGQMDKEVSKRQWSPEAYAALITYIAEACGAVFPPAKKDDAGKLTRKERDTFRAIMQDSDFSFSSNTKKYYADRGFLPKEAEKKTDQFE